MTWRPATKRPRNGQRVIGIHTYCGEFVMVGKYSALHDQCVQDECFPLHWSHFILWIPESELIKAARAAAKGEK